ncbi:serine hydrolase [Rheinheimera hassiensis]|uniref:serine hydrolase n=1 Tax=Rheinheimera hassiensis TaxID=1193627 RepID=UPI001F06A38B|nr:serine hydrolase [Rheinheimera hassiensis]
MFQFGRLIVPCLMISLLSACSYKSSAQPKQLMVASEVDTLINSFLAQTGVSVGVGVAIYTPEGVYVQGFGQANVSGEAVKPDTAFYIASSTKSFVALSMNNQHQQGKINLDSSLATFAPQVPWPAAIKPEQVTLRSLLAHTSGIKNDAIAIRSAYTGDSTPEVLWQLLQTSSVNTNAPLGTFKYTNTGYNILTTLTDKQLATHWQQLITAEIIQPAGMTHTTAYMSEAVAAGWSIASPFLLTPDGKSVQALALDKQDNTMHSAGGMLMSSADALLWLELMIREGCVGSKQILPAAVVRQTRLPLASVDQTFGDYQREDYGLGWYIARYSGQPMLQHFGSFSGFRSHVSYLPEREVGVAVFTNEALVGSFLPDAIANFVYDKLAGSSLGATERATQLTQQFQKLAAGYVKSQQAMAERKWALTLPVEHYAGRYVHPQLGTLFIDADGNVLTARIGLLQGVATAYPQADTIRLALIPPGGELVTFELENRAVISATLFDMQFEKQQN